MKEIPTLINELKQNWQTPKLPTYDPHSFELSCIINDGFLANDLADRLAILGIHHLPKDYLDFMTASNGAMLFYDEKYGQTGLKLYDADEIASANIHWQNSYRNKDLLPSDLIIGEFIGDSDLLLLNCDIKSEAYGKIIISLPIDKREDWYFLSEDFGEFLNYFVLYEGKKYWEYQ